MWTIGSGGGPFLRTIKKSFENIEGILKFIFFTYTYIKFKRLWDFNEINKVFLTKTLNFDKKIIKSSGVTFRDNFAENLAPFKHLQIVEKW